MSHYRLLVLLAVVGLVLIGARCSPPSAPAEPVLPTESSPVVGEGEGEDLVGVKFVVYTNRAQGYTILRPDNWYWRHYIKNEIGESKSTVVDYFITDPEPLPGLGSEYLGRIVIEVSERDLSAYAEAVANLTKSETMVGGQPAERYADDDTVEYQLKYSHKTWRFILTATEDFARQVQIFEQLVSSFKFES